MRIFSSIILSVALASGCIAAEAIVTDGDTLVLEGKAYRLDGIDAPETDQMCIDENGKLWTCGLEARVQLRKHIERRDVQCPGRSSDPVYRNRRVSVCTVAGEEVSLNEWLV